MRKDKESARHLRFAGKSYREIHKLLGIPPSTLSGWFSREEWSIRISNRLARTSLEVSTARIRELNKVRGERLALAYEHARREARSELEILKYNPLFISGLMLYWGEGTKASRKKVSLVNTDIEMVKLFVTFLRNICCVPEEKIRAQLLVYPDLNESELVKEWSAGITIPISNFIKSTIIQGRHPTKRLGQGICIVYVNNTYLKEKIVAWLDLLPRELMNQKYYENI